MYQVFQLLPAERAARLLERARALEFVDGRRTAGGIAGRRKSNRQAAAGRELDSIRQDLINEMLRARPLVSYAQPRRFSLPLVNLAGPGEAYGPHVDAARMTGLDAMPMRTDLSYTLFLCDPASYDGGALKFELGPQSVSVKLQPGQMVVYPSTLVHEVEPVTRGERYCIAGWIESFVHDQEARQLLFRLDRHVMRLMKLLPDATEVQEEALAVYQGLLRALAR
jgi:PKHD-type hydroxylase